MLTTFTIARKFRLKNLFIFDYSPETSRRARALPAVFALLHYGADRFRANIYHNIECAKYPRFDS